MSTICKPMLAASIKNPKDLTYPLGATYKLDGIRALKPTAASVVSRSLKPIKNNYISDLLSLALPVGADGEIIAGANFQQVTKSVMTQDGIPDFTYYMFDYVKDDISTPYSKRMVDLQNWYDTEGYKYPFIKILIPTIVNTADELLEFEAHSLAQGFEGVIVRSLDSPYKNGRSTLNEGYLLKLKQYVDSEATIVGFEELMINNNAPTINALGHQERSSHKANLTNGKTLGSLLVQDLTTQVEFKIGTGFDEQTRREIWNNQSAYLGSIAKYKSFPVGVKDAPRHPVYLGLRSLEDMGE